MPVSVPNSSKVIFLPNELICRKLRIRHFIRPESKKHTVNSSISNRFKTYFKTAWRFLLKNKTFTLINISGLATGTLCCLYILVYVRDQYSYDRHHAHVEDIYRADKIQNSPDGKFKLANSGGFIAPAMKRDFPEIERFTR
jgi:hypothetical protein